MYPGYGNLVPRDIASRALFQVAFHEGRGIFNAETGENEREVYLDLTHIDRGTLQKKLSGILEIYEKFVGEDPYTQPMRVFPAVHYSMGGLWVDYEADSQGNIVVGSPRNQATNIPGLYAVGEVDYQYHGANRLGANSLLSCLYGGPITGPAIASYRKALARSAFDLPQSVFEKAEAAEEEKFAALLSQNQDAKDAENPFRLHQELGETMLRDCTIERHNDRLEQVIEKLDELDERLDRSKLADQSLRMNQSAQFLRHLGNMLVLARVIAQGALNRDECRGAHFKPELEERGRDDENWLRTTLAVHEARGEVKYIREFDYECAGKAVHVTDAVDTSLVKPRPRRYEQAGAASAEAAKKAD